MKPLLFVFALLIYATNLLYSQQDNLFEMSADDNSQADRLVFSINVSLSASLLPNNVDIMTGSSLDETQTKAARLDYPALSIPLFLELAYEPVNMVRIGLSINYNDINHSGKPVNIKQSTWSQELRTKGVTVGLIGEFLPIEYQGNASPNKNIEMAFFGGLTYNMLETKSNMEDLIPTTNNSVRKTVTTTVENNLAGALLGWRMNYYIIDFLSVQATVAYNYFPGIDVSPFNIERSKNGVNYWQRLSPDKYNLSNLVAGLGIRFQM